MPANTAWLLCRVRESLCALPLSQVVEVMRPLPIVPVADAPECVLGLCVMRGEPAPVVDLARCLGGRDGAPTRFVAVRSGERRLALAVDATVGTLELAPERISAVPSVLSRASAALEAVTTLDSALLMLLQTSRVLPESALPELSNHARSR